MKLIINQKDKKFLCFVYFESSKEIKFFTIFHGYEPKPIEDIQKLYDDGYTVYFKENLLEFTDMFDGSCTIFKTVAEININGIEESHSKALEVVQEIEENNPEEFI